MDTLATALGVTWQLGDPYHEPRDLYATPPGSAMFFQCDNNGSVELSYMYPVVSFDNATAIQLQMVPMRLAGESTDSDDLIDASRTVIAVEDLRKRVSSILRRHTGATECFLAAASVLSSSPLVSSSRTSLFATVALVLGGVLSAIFVLLWTYRCYRRNKQNATLRTADYRFVAQQVEME